MDFFEFGINAENLPSDPNLIENGKTYKTDPSTQFIEYGFSSNSVVESSQFNGYIINLINDIKLLLTGICKTIGGIAPISWKKNDLRINSDTRNLEIYDGKSWGPISLEATETTEGYIDPKKLLTEENVKRIPSSTEAKKGSVLKSDKVSDLSIYAIDRDSYHKVYHDIDSANPIAPLGSYELINIKGYSFQDFVENIYHDIVMLDVYSSNDILGESVMFSWQGIIVSVE